MIRSCSVVVLIGATAVLASCSGDSPAGEGPGDGGLGGASGRDAGGGDVPRGSSGADASGPTGMAAIKFCNALANGDDTSFEAEMVVGQVRLKAGTGACSSAPGQPCTVIPAGLTDMSLRRAVGGMVLATRQFTFEAGIEYVALTDFNDVVGKAEIISQALSSATKCAPLGFNDLTVPTPPSSDAGAPPSDDAGYLIGLR